MPCLPLRDLGSIRVKLRGTGRGKHVAGCSYYHVETLRLAPRIAKVLRELCSHVAGTPFAYDAVKLERVSRISFLRYRDFGAAFPVLAASLTVDLAAGTARTIDYCKRRNPPILHRKELLLPAGHPLAAGAADLTARLEARGAFADLRRIGTLDGWSHTLAEIGLALDRGEVVCW